LSLLILGPIAYIDAYLCHNLFPAQYPPTSIAYWWRMLGILLAVIILVVVASFFVARGPYVKQQDYVGGSLIMLTGIILVLSGIFDLFSSSYITIMQGEKLTSLWNWGEWWWLDQNAFLLTIALTQGHTHVLFQDILIGTAIGIISVSALWMWYLSRRAI